MNTEVTNDPITDQLAKVNLTQAVVERLKQHSEPILAEEIKDKVQFDAVDRLRKDAKNLRLAGEKIFEHEIAERHRLHKEAIAKKKEVLADIIDVETRAEARQFAWKHEQEQIAKKAEEARVAAIEARRTSLMELGYILRDHVWTLDGVSIDAEEVLRADHFKWENLFRSLRMHGEEVAAAKAEAARLQEEEAARLAKEKQDLEARETALKEAEAKMLAKLNETRKNELLSMGCTEWEQDNGLGMRGYIGVRFIGPSGSLVIYPYAVADLSKESQWDEVIKDVRHALGELKQHEESVARARARQELIDTRVDRLKEAGWFESTHPQGGQAIGLQGEDGSYMEFVMVDNLYQQNDETFGMMLERGRAELGRRQAAKEEAIRQQERDRIAKEQADKAEAERLATEQRIARDGDMEYVRQVLSSIADTQVVIETARLNIKTKAIMDAVHVAMNNIDAAEAQLNEVLQ